jgi:antitoxin Phd
MLSIAAREAKNEFGRLLDTARREAVTIEKRGRPVAVLVSIEEYERLQEVEDSLWAEKAKEAEKGGFLSVAESKDFLNELRKKLREDDV